MKRFISSGEGFICIHVAGCAPDNWPEYSDVTGGGWDIVESFHRPYEKFTVNVSNTNHPGAKDVSDFITSDELYMMFEDGNDYFVTADAPEGTHLSGGGPKQTTGGTFSLGWTRRYGEGRVFTVDKIPSGLKIVLKNIRR